MDFRQTTILELTQQVQTGAMSCQALVTAALENIHRLNPIINAFCALDDARALADAAKVDQRLAVGEHLPLAGIPFGVKDLEDAQGYITTFGSAFHTDDAPALEDSELVRRLRAAGAIVVGKTNTPEFGYKGKTDNVPFGITKNPWDLTRTPGDPPGDPRQRLPRAWCHWQRAVMAAARSEFQRLCAA